MDSEDENEDEREQEMTHDEMGGSMGCDWEDEESYEREMMGGFEDWD